MPLRRAAARILLGAAGTQLGLRLAATATGPIGPLRVRAALELAARGATDVDVPPLGRARLRTHAGPLRLRLLATGIDVDAAQALLTPTEQSGLLTPTEQSGLLTPTEQSTGAARRQARSLGTQLAIRSAAAGLGGAAALLALAARRPRDVALGTATSAAGLLATAALAAATADQDAWRAPQLTGLLTRAPVILGDLRDAPGQLAKYRDQLTELLATGAGVYRRIATLPEPPPADAIRLVHISDVHLSPLAFPLARAVVEQWHADAVLDTGDLVDWGTPAEQAVATQIASLTVPYVYIKGNHDSDGIAAAVARQPNAVVLSAGDEPRHVAGLTFVGMADPRFTPDKTTGDDHDRTKIVVAAKAFARTIVETDHVDVALVHAPRAARELAGRVPLVLAGDIHRRDAQDLGHGTTLLVQGSTGGSGLRGVQVDPPTPITLSVLYLARATRRLVCVDEITLDGLGGVGLTVARRTVDELVGARTR